MLVRCEYEGTLLLKYLRFENTVFLLKGIWSTPELLVTWSAGTNALLSPLKITGFFAELSGLLNYLKGGEVIAESIPWLLPRLILVFRYCYC